MTEKLSDDYKYIEDNLCHIRDQISEAALKAGRRSEEIRLMAVTKTVPVDAVNVAIAHGVDLLGENRVQELCKKYDAYDKNNVEIHFIGHLQTNKVRQIVDKVEFIHSLDSIRLAREINKHCIKLNKTLDVLIEVNIGSELSKTGLLSEQVEDFAEQIGELSNIRLRGLMAIPPICNNLYQAEQYFSDMQRLLVDIQAKKIDNSTIDILSMGMSGDFEQAIKYGANIIRLGTAIFGNRACYDR